MKMLHKFFSWALLTFAPIALISGCDGSSFEGLIKETSVHSVGTKTKMSNLLKDAHDSLNRTTYSYDVNLGGETGLVEDAGSGGARDYVDTNEQVEGVKEGDIVKTDGYEIFYAARYRNAIRVVAVEDNYDVTLAKTIDLGNTYVDSLYLLDDYIVVIGYQYEEFDNGYEDEADIYYRWWSPTGSVQVIDRMSFETVYQLVFDSFFMDHRIIEDSIFLVSNKYLYYDNNFEYRPTYRITQGGESTVEYLDFSSIYYFDDTPAYGMNVLTGIKLADDPDDIAYNANAYLGASADYKKMYVNTTDMYLVESIYHWSDNSSYTTSTISQFALNIDEASTAYVAAIIVVGSSLNQFSMDVYDGYLRIATTDRRSRWSGLDYFGWWDFSSTVENHLFVMRVDSANETFALVGHLSENLGKPGEDIKSVRFEQNTAYIVTFLQTDPLYIIDLSNPAAPSIAGEIEQEGFDLYQHVWGEGNLIGIGYDADTNGMVTGMKLSAYNVKSGEEETLQTYNLYTYENANDSSWTYGFSEALYNHKAMLVSVDRGYLGFSVQAYEYGSVDTESGRVWYSIYHSYYYLFSIDFTKDNPISDPVIIEHPTSVDYYVGVDRGVMIDDYLYTISDQRIITYSLLDQAIIEPPLLFE
ncbi:MAG: beta-propeller domain-containing protein [Bacilli bacterium]|jgi:uncharacterized secreted protein with C-terminal beta-propeller domain